MQAESVQTFLRSFLKFLGNFLHLISIPPTLISHGVFTREGLIEQAEQGCAGHFKNAEDAEGINSSIRADMGWLGSLVSACGWFGWFGLIRSYQVFIRSYQILSDWDQICNRLHTEMYLVHVMELPWWPAAWRKTGLGKPLVQGTTSRGHAI